MKVLGIDQSYRSCGIVVLKDGEMIHCEKYTTTLAMDIYARAAQLADHLRTVVQEHTPDLVALEGLSFGSTGNVTRDLGGLLFTIILAMRKEGYDPVVIAPPTVKKIATGKGNSKKEMLIECLPSKVRAEFDAMGVKKTTGLTDLTDAYWVAVSAEKMNENG